MSTTKKLLLRIKWQLLINRVRINWTQPVPRKVQAIVLGPLRTLVTDHGMLHWFCALVAWPCCCYRKRLTPGNWLVFKITTLARFALYRMVKLHTNQFSGVSLLVAYVRILLLIYFKWETLCICKFVHMRRNILSSKPQLGVMNLVLVKTSQTYLKVDNLTHNISVCLH